MSMTGPRVIKSIDCVETTEGILLFWELYDGITNTSTSVYGVDKDSRQLELVSPLVSTGRLLINADNYPLITGYKIKVTTEYGLVDESDVITPQKVKKTERRLINDMKRRTRILFKATPIGSYKFKLMLRRLEGEPCECCGSVVCAGVGGEGPSDSCPICVGTGITDPYYLYPNTELMSGITPVEDGIELSQNPATLREIKTHTFQAVSDIHLRVNDMLVSGIEVYKVLEHKVGVSVGGAPVNYTLTCAKLLPDDPKYKVILELSKGGSVNE